MEQSRIPLSPFLASMEFRALRGKVSFQDIDFPTGKERLISVKGTPVIFTAYNPSSRSESWEINGNPRFWEERVKQLSFDFERKDWNKIRDFYVSYGPVKPMFLSATLGIDFSGTTQRGLIWFRYLTNITDWVKNGKLSRLREFFSREDCEFFQLFSFGISRIRPLEKSLEFSQSQEEISNRFLDVLKPSFTISDAIMAAIHESVSPDLLGKEMMERAPEVSTLKDHELIGYTWDLIATAVGAKLETIELVPVHQQGTKSIPPVVWYFRAYCALDAAFLQWYFQEVAPLMVRTCEAPGCNAPVLDPRAKYCSRRCYERAKKRRYLERKRKSN